MQSFSPIRLPNTLVQWLIKVHLFGMALLLHSTICLAQDTSRNVVETYVLQSRKVVVERAARVLVFNEEICSTRIDSTGIEFFGLKRGESVVFVWSNDDVRTTYLVRVISPPELAVP